MALPARRHPLGLNAAFVTQTGTELLMKEKIMSLSGDSFTVQDANGQGVVQIKGEAFSLSGRKHVMDMQGKQLFDIRKEHFTLLSKYYVEDANGQKVVEVNSKFKMISSEAVIKFTNVLGGNTPVELSMKGDFLSRNADIVDKATGESVASIRRKGFNARNLLGGQDTYFVQVAAGVDLALIAAICVCFDEKNRENKS